MTETNDDRDQKNIACSTRYRRWRIHLEERGTTIPDVEDFLTFGALSTLERLRAELSRILPEQCGPLARAISQLKREKNARAGSRAKGGQRGPAASLSIDAKHLPADWLATLADMRMRREAIDTGMIDIGGINPPAASQLRAIEYVLRAIGKVCTDLDRTVGIDLESVEAWSRRQLSNGQNETSTGLQLRKIIEFLRYRKEEKKLRKKLSKEAARLARIGRLKRKRKYTWLLKNPTDIGKVWTCAEDLLADSRAATAGTAGKYHLALHASALALAVAAPLRISDLARFRIGKEICRDAVGWSIRIKTQKTGGEYERTELWPELNDFLDALITIEAPGGDLWIGHDTRQGTPLFSRDGGTTGLAPDWISDVWYEHVGTGEHIVRTLWHQLAYDSDIDRTWMALALCGQVGRRTAGEYHDKNQRAKAVRAGRKTLLKARQQAISAQQ
jgi:integrase